MMTYCYCCLQRTRGQTGAAAVCVHMHVSVSVHLPCCVYAGCSLELQCFEIKTEAVSSDITEYLLDDTPSTGMFVLVMDNFRSICFHVSVVLSPIAITTTSSSDEPAGKLRGSYGLVANF